MGSNVKTQVEPIIFTELGGGCDDEHLKRVEPRKGDVVRRRLDWWVTLFWLGYFGMVVGAAAWAVVKFL